MNADDAPGASPGVKSQSAVAVDSFSLTDIDGQVRRPFSDSGTKIVVLVFISTDCPVANYYHPTLRKIGADYANRGVRMYFVHANPDVTVERARQHAKEFSLAAPVALDPKHVVARQIGATKTPQAAVVTTLGEVAYLGRIDDTYLGYGKKRSVPAVNDLRDALDAVLAGKPVPAPRTESVGCFIPFREEKTGAADETPPAGK